MLIHVQYSPIRVYINHEDREDIVKAISRPLKSNASHVLSVEATEGHRTHVQIQVDSTHLTFGGCWGDVNGLQGPPMSILSNGGEAHRWERWTVRIAR